MNLDNEQVLVETTLPSGQIQELLEQTGRKTVLRGHGAGGGYIYYFILSFCIDYLIL